MERETKENVRKKNQTSQIAPSVSEGPQTKGFRRRMIAIAIVVAIILLVFIVRLVQFQLINGSEYAEQAARSSVESTISSRESLSSG